MWPAEPKLFAVWPFIERLLTPDLEQAAECSSCSNAQCFYSYSEMEGDARNILIFIHSQPVFQTCPLYLSYKGPTQPREQKCFLHVLRIAYIILFLDQ